MYQNNQVKKELAKSLNLSSGVGNDVILNLSREAKDSGLLHRAPRDEIGAQEHSNPSVEFILFRM